MIGEWEVIRLPSFEPAEPPGYIEAKRDNGEHHDQEPVPKESESSSMKGQLAFLDKGMFRNPSLLSGIGPREKQAKSDKGEDPGPDE